MVSEAISQIGIFFFKENTLSCSLVSRINLARRRSVLAHGGCRVRCEKKKKLNKKKYHSFKRHWYATPPPPPPSAAKAKWIKPSLNMHLVVNHMQVKRIRSQFVKWQNPAPLKNSLFGELRTTTSVAATRHSVQSGRRSHDLAICWCRPFCESKHQV